MGAARRYFDAGSRTFQEVGTGHLGDTTGLLAVPPRAGGTARTAAEVRLLGGHALCTLTATALRFYELPDRTIRPRPSVHQVALRLPKNAPRSASILCK